MGKAFINMAFVISTIFDCQLSFDKSTSSVYVMYKCIQVLLDNILSKFCLFLPPSSYPSIRGGQGIFTTARFVDERAPHDQNIDLQERGFWLGITLVILTLQICSDWDPDDSSPLKDCLIMDILF